MFFKCMNALHGREGGFKWVLLTHTVAMFSFVTVAIAALLYTLSGSYIDSRGFPGPDSSPWSGPIGYQLYTYHEPLRVIPLVALVLNNWLADGLLVRSVFDLTFQAPDAVRHPSSIVAIPSVAGVIGPSLFRALCILPLWVRTCALHGLTAKTSNDAYNTALGTIFIYESARPIGILSSTPGITDFGTPAYSISLSLNILLTTMIIVRIVIHDSDFREKTGKSSRLVKAVVAMLVESCALYTLSFVLYFGPWIAHNSLANLFFTSFVAVQVCPFAFSSRRNWALHLTVTNRLLPRSSSFYGWQTAPRLRQTLYLGAIARFISAPDPYRRTVASHPLARRAPRSERHLENFMLKLKIPTLLLKKRIGTKRRQKTCADPFDIYILPRVP